MQPAVQDKPKPTVPRARSILAPLSPVLYLWRNPGQTIPLSSVIVMAVLLIAGIVALLNSIPYSIRTVFGYNKSMVVVVPRAEPEVAAGMRESLSHAPHLGRTMTTRVAILRVKTLVGQMPFPGIGLEQKDMPYVLNRLDLTLMKGRLPRAGEAACAVTEAVALNRALKINSTLLAPNRPEEFAPADVKVVGILKGSPWFVVMSSEFIRDNYFPDVTEQMLMADQPQNQRVMDRWVVEKMKGSPARVWAYEEMLKETEKDLNTLYLILNIAIAALVTVLATMMGMLSNIHFSQRMVEFGLLQAIGHSRRFLLSRTVWEMLIVVVFAWLVGIVLSHFALELVRASVMEPKGYPMVTGGWDTYRYTLFVPAAIGLFGVVTVWWRFRLFDPVAIVERRVV